MNGMTTSGPTASVFMTDFYQMTSAYALWKSGKHNERAVYDYFYRTPPFGGVYALFAGLRDLLDYVARFRYTPEKVARMRELLPRVEPEFFAWLAGLDYSDVRIYAMREGSLAFPRVPMIRVEGPAAPAQMLETHLLALCNFPSGIMTNAARYRVAATRSSSSSVFVAPRTAIAHRTMRCSGVLTARPMWKPPESSGKRRRAP